MYFHKIEKSFPIYRGRFVIILSNDRDKLVNMLPDVDFDYLYAHSVLTSWKGMEGYIVILNMDSQYRKIHMGTIAHEAVHIANMLFEQRGITLSAVNDEPFAYLVEWIVDEIHKFINKNNFFDKILA